MRNFIFLILTLIIVGCGRNIHSERYVIHCTERDFVQKVDSLKSVHPDLRQTTYGHDESCEDSDRIMMPFKSMGRKDILDYEFVFNIPSENRSFCCLIPSYDSLSQDKEFYLEFITVSDKNHSVYYGINTKELSKEDNSRYKRILENCILEKLNVEWERSSNF